MVSPQPSYAQAFASATAFTVALLALQNLWRESGERFVNITWKATFINLMTSLTTGVHLDVLALLQFMAGTEI